jgi:DNA primase
VEGYMDAIGVTAAGFGPVVASCGTALTAQQVKLLKQHTARIVVNFDPDTAGANAAARSIDILLAEGMQVRILELDGELDPDEYCKERGPAAYQERLEGAKGYFYWLADRARAKHDMRTSEGQVSVLKSLMPAVQKISDQMERMVIAGDLASYIGVDRGMVLDSFKKSVAERQENKFQRPAVVLRHDEKMLINAVLTRPELAATMVPELKTMEIVATFPSRRVFQAMFALQAGGTRMDFEALHSRLEKEDRELLPQASLGDDVDVSEEEFAAAMASVRRSEGEHRRAELKRRIKESERSGDWNEALRLAAELQSLERGTRSRL